MHDRGATFDSERALAIAARRSGQRGKALEHFRAAAALRPDVAWNLGDIAAELIELGRLDEAQEIAARVAEKHPALPVGSRILAVLARKRGRRDEALQHLQAAADRAPDDVSIKGEIASVLRELGRRDEAEATARAIVDKRPDLPVGWRVLGAIARARGQRAEALEHFQTAGRLDPGDLWNQGEIATTLRELGRLDEAEATARAVADKRPDLTVGWRALGAIARARGRRAEALEHFQTAGRLDPGDLWNQSEIATMLRELGRLDEAEATARGIADKRPDLTVGWRVLGAIARARGRRAEALEHFQTADRLDPGDQWNQSEIATMLRELGRLDEAEATARAIADKRPDLAAGWRVLGDLARRRGDMQQALEHLRAAAACEPQNLSLRAEVASALRELHQFKEAEAYAQALTASHPGSALAWMTLAQCSRNTRSSREVLALVEKAVACEPDSVHARQALAREYAAAWRLEEAEAIYDAILAAEAQNLAALVGKALIARRRGDRAKSLEILAAAAKVAPDSEWVMVERARDLVDAGRAEEAEQGLAALIESNPNRSGALLFLGQNARAQGESEKARRYFEAAAALGGNNDNAVVELAVEDYRSGRHVAARQRLQDLLARRPNNVRAVEVLAEIAQGLHDAEATLELRRAALALDDSGPGRRLSLARLEAAWGRTEEAHRILAECEARFGRLPDIALSRAHIEIATGNRAGALATLTEAQAAFPTHFEIWFQLVRALIWEGRFDEALHAVEAPPGSGERERSRALFLRGQIAAAQWRLEDAAADFAEAMIHSPADGWICELAARNALVRVDIEAVERYLKLMARNNAAHRSMHGGGLKSRVTLVGQILEEYCLDSDSLVRLRAANATDDPIAALQTLVRDRPDYTPAAIGLLVRLRRRGWLDRPASAPRGTSLIPRRIGQFWDDQIPPEIERLCDEWRTKNPDFAYRRFSNAEAQDYLAQFGPRGAREAFALAVDPAMKADLLRLALLFHVGGFYADADDRCVLPLAEIDPGDCELVLGQEDFGTAGNNFIGAIPHHPVIAEALTDAIAAILRGDREILWLATGPGLMTRSLARYLVGGGRDRLDRIRLFDRHELHRAIAPQCAASYRQKGGHWHQRNFARARAARRRSVRPA